MGQTDSKRAYKSPCTMGLIRRDVSSEDTAASKSLWAAEYAPGSGQGVVVAIDLTLAAVLTIFLWVVWRQWRKGKGPGEDAAKSSPSPSPSTAPSASQPPPPAADGDKMEEKDEVVVISLPNTTEKGEEDGN